MTKSSLKNQRKPGERNPSGRAAHAVERGVAKDGVEGHADQGSDHKSVRGPDNTANKV